MLKALSVNEPTLCVGADVHLDEIVLRAVDKTDGHEVLERFHVTNNLPGAQSAATTLAQAAAQKGYTHLEIGWEATGLLWVPFHRFLSASPLLHLFTPELVCFNPKLVANFKDGLVLRRPKNDERDAWDVAARVRFGEWPVSYVPADFWQGLRRLTRYRYQLSRNLSREEMRFQSYAFLKASDWKRVKPFSNVFGATSIALLTEVGDIRRFPDGEHAASFLGLTTSKHISGATLYQSKHITKQGSPNGRYAAVNMALHLSQRVPKYRAMYKAIKSRKPPRKGHFVALVAIAGSTTSNRGVIRRRAFMPVSRRTTRA